MADLTPEQQYNVDLQNQYNVETYRALFTEYGIDDRNGSLYNQLLGFVQAGLTGDALDLALRGTSEYQERFKGNKALKDSGQATWSPAEYISIEKSMFNSMTQFGIPKEFMTNDYYAKLIGGGISPNELNDRVAEAAQVVYSSPSSVRDEYARLYGISSGDLIAGFLDPKVAEPILKKRVATSTIGAAAKDQGVRSNMVNNIASANEGISYSDAARGFAQAQQLGTRGQELSQIYGGDKYGIEEATKETFGLAGAAKAETTKKKLASKERASFSGSSGIRAGSLSQDGRAL